MISVIINVYNGEKYIKKCLNSVINQTYKDLEILIINDGSTDKTLEICKSFKDKRIRIISTKNVGLSLSRNIGIENAKGDYLYFIDVDDLIEKDTIEYLYNLCKTYKVKLATAKELDIDDYNYKVKNKEEIISILSGEDMLKNVLLSKNRQEALWNKLISKDLIKNKRFENRLTDDITLTYKIVNDAKKVAYSNQIKYFYFKHRDSLSKKNKQNFDIVKDMYKAYLERYDNVKKMYPDLIECEASLLWIIPRFYIRKDKNIKKYLRDNGAIKLYKKLFSFKVLKCDIGIREKIKIILFRIHPRLHIINIRLYQIIRGIKP